MARARGVMHVITGLSTGGAERMLAKLLAGDPRLRDGAVVVGLAGEGRVAPTMRALGVPVYCLGLPPQRPSLRLYTGLARLVRQHDPAALQGWMYHGSAAAQLVGGLGRRPVLWNIRQTVRLCQEKRSNAWLVRTLAVVSRLPARIVYNSHCGAADHQALGFRPEKTVVIANGFDTDQFQPDASARVWLRQRLGLPPEAALIGMAARWDPMKGHGEFLAAAARVRAQGARPHFVLAGPGVELGQPELAFAIARHGLRGVVHCMGEVEEMPRWFAGLDIATSTSVMKEGFSNAVGEAMACGLPCVVSRVGDAERLVGEAGIVVEPGDAEAMALAWSGLLAAGADERQRRGAAARRRVLEEFAMPRIASAYSELYQSLALT